MNDGKLLPLLSFETRFNDENDERIRLDSRPAFAALSLASREEKRRRHSKSLKLEKIKVLGRAVLILYVK